jgi:hypothetical protein
MKARFDVLIFRSLVGSEVSIFRLKLKMGTTWCSETLVYYLSTTRLYE